MVKDLSYCLFKLRHFWCTKAYNIISSYYNTSDAWEYGGIRYVEGKKFGFYFDLDVSGISFSLILFVHLIVSYK